jgi:hypothetical protein
VTSTCTLCTLLPTCTKNGSKSMRLLASLSITTTCSGWTHHYDVSKARFTRRVPGFYSHSWIRVSEKTSSRDCLINHNGSNSEVS